MSIAVASIVADPANHFKSLAPANTTTGPLFEASSDVTPCTQAQAWHTPQLRSLLYLYMAALLFSAVVEPMLLYLARYKLRSVGDAERVMAGVLISFSFFDVAHALAAYLVAGPEAVLPAADLDLSNLELYACINVWVPTTWLLIRVLWFMGVGRASAVGHEKME